MSAAVAAALVPALVLSAALFFYLFAFPVWAAFDCFRSEMRQKDKWIWTILILFFTWTAGAIVYGVLASDRSGVRRAAWGGVMLTGVLVFLAVWAIPRFGSIAAPYAKEALETVQKADASELSPEARAGLLTEARALDEEIRQPGTWREFRRFGRKMAALDLLTLLRAAAGDGRLTAAEAAEWKALYRDRETARDKISSKLVQTVVTKGGLRL